MILELLDKYSIDEIIEASGAQVDLRTWALNWHTCKVFIQEIEDYVEERLFKEE